MYLRQRELQQGRAHAYVEIITLRMVKFTVKAINIMLLAV